MEVLTFNALALGEQVPDGDEVTVRWQRSESDGGEGPGEHDGVVVQRTQPSF